jgi:hypothetical protein
MKKDIKYTSLNLIQTVFKGLFKLKIVEDMLILSPKVTLDLVYKYWISMIMVTIIGLTKTRRKEAMQYHIMERQKKEPQMCLI